MKSRVVQVLIKSTYVQIYINDASAIQGMNHFIYVIP